jgi:hypothetical protein
MSGTTSPNEQQQASTHFSAMQVPQFLFNAFANGFSGTEITSVLSFGQRPFVTMVMAPSTAKSYALALLDTLRQFEEATGLPVPTVQELSERMTAYQSSHAA